MLQSAVSEPGLHHFELKPSLSSTEASQLKEGHLCSRRYLRAFEFARPAQIAYNPIIPHQSVIAAVIEVGQVIEDFVVIILK